MFYNRLGSGDVDDLSFFRFLANCNPYAINSKIRCDLGNLSTQGKTLSRRGLSGSGNYNSNPNH